MKIISISDLHIDICFSEEGISILPYLINCIKEENPDLIIIAGDISDFSYQSIRIIEDIENQTNTKVYFIPGNHDVWNDSDSWEEYNLFKSHHSSLIDNPIELPNNYVIIGDMGWYDYSFKLDEHTDKEVSKYINSTNQGQFSKWNMSDKKLTEMLIKKLNKTLDKYKNSKIIFVNHFVPYKDFILVTQSKQWNLLNGMMGSSEIGKLIDKYENIEYVIFGHTHKRFGTVVKGNKKIICNPLGYANEWLFKYTNAEKNNNIENIIIKEIKDSFTIINI